MSGNTMSLAEARKKRGSIIGDGGGGADDRKVIRIVAGQLHRAIDEAESALLAAGRGPIFQRGGELVQISSRPARRSDGTIDLQEAITLAEAPAVREAFGVSARFEKYDVRAGDWRAVDPPKPLVEQYMSRPHWRLPDLQALIATPTLRPDGSLLARGGYDRATGLYLTAELPGLEVLEEPGDHDAHRANDALVDLLKSFPFSDSQHKGLSLAVALAGLFGAVLRPTLPAAPLIGVTAPAPGTGKSYLVDLLTMIATGRPAVTMATGGKIEEFEKALGAALLSGRPALSMDNMTQALGGQLLCMILTQSRVDIRLLGFSKTIEVPVSAQLFATGNNLKVRGDATRRVLLCALDARVEQPEQREFEVDLLAEASRRRAELVSAVLTIARWHQRRREQAPQGLPFAGFDMWCQRVRDPLLALGHADPVAALETTRRTDTDDEMLSSLMAVWQERIGAQPLTCAEVARRASTVDAAGAREEPDLAAALSTVAGDAAGRVNTRRLGKFLAHVEDRILRGRVFRRDSVSGRAVRWRVEEVSG